MLKAIKSAPTGLQQPNMLTSAPLPTFDLYSQIPSQSQTLLVLIMTNTQCCVTAQLQLVSLQFSDGC